MTVVLAILGAWLLLAVLTTVACAALARGGLHEDRARGYEAEHGRRSRRNPSRTADIQRRDRQDDRVHEVQRTADPSRVER